MPAKEYPLPSSKAACNNLTNVVKDEKAADGNDKGRAIIGRAANNAACRAQPGAFRLRRRGVTILSSAIGEYQRHLLAAVAVDEIAARIQGRYWPGSSDTPAPGQRSRYL